MGKNTSQQIEVGSKGSERSKSLRKSTSKRKSDFTITNDPHQINLQNCKVSIKSSLQSTNNKLQNFDRPSNRSNSKRSSRSNSRKE